MNMTETEPIYAEFPEVEQLSDGELAQLVEQTAAASQRAADGPALAFWGRALNVLRQERERRGYETYPGLKTAVQIQATLAAAGPAN
jgi:hypothetical protein